jgi:hypothetical protein
MTDQVRISVRGRTSAAPVETVCGARIICRGSMIRIGEVFDEYWLEPAQLPPYPTLIEELSERGNRPDIFTFAQRIPDALVRFPQYHHETENYAVLALTSHEEWMRSQVSSATRRNIKAAAKRGIRVVVSDYDAAYVQGISGIYNESRVRAGRRFWHYGKDLAAVGEENGTYRERSTYLAALYDTEMIGYMKIVWNERNAAIMQILSKLAHRDLRPNNALMSEAVRQCCLRGAERLIYERFDYGKKSGDSLTRFKQGNGFTRLDLPRYYVPLTMRGSLALSAGMHHDIGERMPEWMAGPLRNARQKWYESSLRTVGSSRTIAAKGDADER